MPINHIEKNHPICDTDIWIKSCKYKEIYKEELIFHLYEKIFMSDAVRQELGRERKDMEPFNPIIPPDILKKMGYSSGYESVDKQDFQIGLNHFYEENGQRINVIKSFDEKFFDEREKKALEKAFLENEIVFDQRECKYKGSKRGLGEKVTLIMASILEIPVILSDDGHTRNGVNSMINRYPYLKVINLHNLLNKKYTDINQISEIKKRVNDPISTFSEIAVSSEYTSKPNLKSYKNKFKKNSI